MSMRDEMNAIANSKHLEKVEFKAKVDKLVGELYKAMFKSAHKGEYHLNVYYKQEDKAVYREVMNLLESDDFYIEPLKDAEPKHKGLYRVSWE